VLDTLVTQGKVRYIGVSNWAAWKIAKALAFSEFKNVAYPVLPGQRFYCLRVAIDALVSERLLGSPQMAL
jgi:aryl-alcohol dehydrogenase-like predicted oxidoreductase